MSSPHSVVVISLVLAFIMRGATVSAQAGAPHISDRPTVDEYLPISDADISTMRSDIRHVKKQIIAANLKLTDVEAEKFWPVYDNYMAELEEIDNSKYALIKQDIATRGLLSDTDADNVAERWLEIDRLVIQLRLKYIPSFRKVLSPKKTALFCQLERHVQMAIDMRLASSLPVIQP